MEGMWKEISVEAVKLGLNLLAAILIFILGKWAAKIVSKFSEGMMTKAKVNHTLASFTKNIVYYGLLIFVAIAALNKVGIETNSFVALVGAAGLAVGFALQGSLANFAAGVMIIFFQPFQVGDTIEAAGAIGKVEEIQIFNTVLLGEGNKLIIIPNGKLTADKIVVSLPQMTKPEI
ncbi:MAG: mechanosensitive ion channel [Candidatus Omnitrophica bacterium]|nr:mechanosensitive ion channel [Candidatus Omnitrophota bacterium]